MLKKVLIFSLLAQQSCVSTLSQQSCTEIATKNDACRPLRAGMFHTNRALDRKKPLSAIDQGGWVLIGDSLIGSPDDTVLQSLSMQNKRSQWKIDLPATVSAPISSIDDSIIVGTRDGSISKVSAVTGKSIWSNNIGRFLSRRAVVHQTSVLATTVDQKLFALDISSGKVLWVYDAGTPSNLVIGQASEPKVMGNIVFLGTASGDVHGVDLTNGHKLFVLDIGRKSTRFNDIVGEIATVKGNVIAARYDGVVFSTQAASGRRQTIWKKELPGVANSHYRDGIYFVSCLNGDFIALDASNGRELWKSYLGEAAASITAHEKVVLIGGMDGRVVSLRVSDGLRLWSDDLEGALTSHPVQYNGILYFSTGLKVHYGYKLY